MISAKELEHVVAQVNSKFEELFKKIATLEEDVKNANSKAPKGKSKS
jgi:SPX domain protein involved in polyphosphate accumulation